MRSNTSFLCRADMHVRGWVFCGCVGFLMCGCVVCGCVGMCVGICGCVGALVRGRQGNFDIRDVNPEEAADKCFIPALFAHADGDDFVLGMYSQKSARHSID